MSWISWRARLWRQIPGAGLVALALILGLSPAAMAGTASLVPQNAVVIRDDHGGKVVTRIREIGALRRSGRDVRIVGSVCYSTCTMLIGLETACVSPETEFGFHGPSQGGRKLDRAAFERASSIIAAHYPPVIRAWYLQTARYEIDGIHRVSGADLIALGMRRC